MKKVATLLATIFAAALLFTACEEKIEVEEFGVITGVVLSDSANTAIANARISSTPASSIALTDSNGNFSLSRVPVGEIAVKAEKNGFKMQTSSVNVQEGDTVNVFFLLTESATSNTGNNEDDLFNPYPEDEATNIPVDTNFTWSYRGSTTNLTYDVFLYSSNSPVKTEVVVDTNEASVNLSNLDYETLYFWYVVAKKNGNEVATSKIWSFRTQDFPDNPLVFAREVNGNFEIFSSSLMGNTQVQLTNHSSRNWNPATNPANTKIAFTSNRVFDYQIYAMDEDGDDLEQVTYHPVTGYHNQGLGYCWAPNGSGFLYSHYDKLYFVRNDGSGLTTIKDTAPASKNWREVDWSGYTNKIVAQATGVNIYNSEIYLMDDDGSNVTLLVPDNPGRTEHPVFSLDGSKILYTHDAQGSNSSTGRQLDARIYMLDLSTMNVTDLSANKPAGTNDLMPEFSPNGAKIIFVNEDNTGTGAAIYEMDLNGDNRELVLDNATMPFAE